MIQLKYLLMKIIVLLALYRGAYVNFNKARQLHFTFLYPINSVFDTFKSYNRERKQTRKKLSRNNK